MRPGDVNANLFWPQFKWLPVQPFVIVLQRRVQHFRTT